MKKISKVLFTGCFILAAQFAKAQTSNGVWNQLSVEGQYGLNMALSPNEGITTGDYNAFKFFQFGVNYHIDDVWGVRGSFAHSAFEHKDQDDLGVKYNKLVLEATYNIFEGLQSNVAANGFDVTAHAGFGLGIGKSESQSGDDMAGIAQIGVMPKYAVSPRIAVFLDATFVNQFSQDYGFNGLKSGQSNGSYFDFGVGVQIKMGQH